MSFPTIFFYVFVLCFFAHSKAESPTPPDGWWCDDSLGLWSKGATQACRIAWAQMPSNVENMIYTTLAPPGEPYPFHQVPIRYRDNTRNPRCFITIDLDGHSKNDTMVVVSDGYVRHMAYSLMTKCVLQRSGPEGGVRTYGLGSTISQMIHNPVRYEDGSRIDDPVLMVGVEGPDGTVSQVGRMDPVGAFSRVLGGVEHYSEFLIFF